MALIKSPKNFAMKKIILTILVAACIMVALSSHTVVHPKGQVAKNSALYRVQIKLVGSNGLPTSSGAFYFYALDANTWAFYEFDDRENAYLLPAGTYYFEGMDATGSGWCGVSGTQANITCNTTITMNVWCE
jgi:hypothetical protein